MNSVGAFLLCTTYLLGGTPPCGVPQKSPKKFYLNEACFDLDGKPRGKLCEYTPQAGDVFFFTDDVTFWHITYKMAFAGPPYHAALVVKMPDGEYRLLEAGPNDTFNVELCSLQCRLQSWVGWIHVRRRVEPLTKQQSDALTDFALRQNGKRYGFLRLGGQITPLRSRGPLRTYFMATPNGECSNYLCAEIVVEGLLNAKALDPKNCRPRATYPCDMFFDKSTNLFLNKHFKLAPDWHPPQLITIEK